MSKPASTENADAPPPLFLTTRWSVVVTAQDKASPDSAEALEALCRAYWYPLYVFVRRQGHTPHDAQDLTQEFFAQLLEKDWLRAAEQGRGRFRTFLIISMKWFLAHEWQRRRAEKRGGGRTPLSLDAALAEERYRAEPSGALPADHLYERRWALTLLEQAMTRLRGEYEGASRSDEFDKLKAFLTAERGTVPYQQVAAALGTTEGAARVAMHRLRKRFRAVFREAIADTVSNPEEVDDEVRYVVAVLSSQ